ncbi:MAG: L-aspartate oxidase, partial [Odoribacteraceae bacterium]|nr:L-aspartate oxidase [Odoribacteraceae bacterium]
MKRLTFATMIHHAGTYDHVIIGSGLAGLYAAYRAASRGKVALLAKSGIRESNSYFAQGGIAAVTGEDDAPSFHLQDTLAAGRGLCDYPPAYLLVNEGPARVQELIDEGMRFDTENGTLARGLEGGHHQKRILHAGGDATGRMITDFLIDKIERHPAIDIFDNHAVIDLLVDKQGCAGARVWDLALDEEVIFNGHDTILATGGASAIYKRTTNPGTTTGDGIAIAYRAGCRVADMEFIQFHPSAIYTRDGEAFLVSEAVRGEGARLVDLRGERFMAGKHEMAELAPRDVVTRAIFEQMTLHGDEHVYLSLEHMDPLKIRQRFPTIYEKAAALGLDMSRRLPVAPAAHYTVGGVACDTRGRTNIPRLHACGEVASTGIMGANRLASNSLVECLVFGKRAVDDSAGQRPRENFPRVTPRFHRDPSRAEHYRALREEVAAIMTRDAGITRSAAGLQQALRRLGELRDALEGEQHEYFTRAAGNLLLV